LLAAGAGSEMSEVFLSCGYEFCFGSSLFDKVPEFVEEGAAFTLPDTFDG